MAEHGLPEPASLHLTLDVSEIRVQLWASGLADTAGKLLAWAKTQAAVALEAWRPPSGGSVHLDVRTTLSGTSGTANLLVYGGMRFDPAVFPGLEPGQRRAVSLGQLTDWADSGAEVAA
jgi:hypothetical protein